MNIPAEIARREDRLAAIAAARQRLEQRQREADLERGRDEDDDRRPRDKGGKPKGGRYKREFGKPEASAQENFTDSDSRIMKRAGGGFDPAYNAQLAVDEACHIIAAAEVINSASDGPSCRRCCRLCRTTSMKHPRRCWPTRATARRWCSSSWPMASPSWWWADAVLTSHGVR